MLEIHFSNALQSKNAHQQRYFELNLAFELGKQEKYRETMWSGDMS